MKTPLILLAALALAASPLPAKDAPAAAPAAAAAAISKNVTPDEAQKLLKDNPKVVVLDVRTPEEYALGHIAGAKNVDFKAPGFAEKIAALDATQPYLVHCAAGGRSSKAIDLLKGKNFTAIYHLNEGFRAWEKAGKPVEK